MRLPLLLLALLLVPSASHGAEKPLATSSIHFKGLELYSWNENERWFFSLVPGKNALQDKTEIQKVGVQGVAEFKKRLSEVAGGAEIFWNTRKVEGMNLQTPPGSVVREIREACQRAKVRLFKE